MADRRYRETQVLAKVRLFEDFTAEELSNAAAAARCVKKEPGSSFFTQGEEAVRFFVITNGRVKVTQVTPEGHQILVRYAGPGEMFGCVPLYGGKEYPATAVAVTRSEALAWDRRAMDHLIGCYPGIAIRALEFLGRELDEIRDRYQELATERVERRVAQALLRLVGQAGEKVAGGVLIDFPLSRQDLAELTGTTLHTVSRILSGWEQRGFVKSGRQRIVIRKPPEIVAIAEDLETEQLEKP